jgi:TolB-like protein/DNA-binding winged helix-turn-helix (wHTH) protein/Tfp pilus assembly protein PilF
MTNKIYKFATFELDVAEGELREADSSMRLQEKPLRLLSALLDNPQSVVTREQLRDRMWDARTVVNFEQGINVAIKKVRNALGDSAENPRFIETVAKRGYRFLLPVETVTAGVESGGSTPATLVSPPSIDRSSVPRRTGWALQVGLLAVIVAAIVATLSVKHFEAPRYRSLAVLPLRNLSPDGGQEFLADGITEDLVTSLAESLPLKVISTNSVMGYKHMDKPIREIAKELGVDAIVVGSVARSSDRVSVTAQLIDAREDRHLWAESYERHSEDILGIESDVAHAIAGRISATLRATTATSVVAGSVDPAVYDLYLMGRFHWKKRTVAGFAQAKRYFEQALVRDPNYAPAYVGLAEVLFMSVQYGVAPSADAFTEAESLAEHAISLDDNLAQAHAILGFIKVSDQTAWKQSETELRRAIAIDPSLAEAHHWLAYWLLFHGRLDEALAEIAEARSLEPMSAITNADEGHFLYIARHYVEARARLARAMELAPELGRPHGTLALIEWETGHPEEAKLQAHTALELDPISARTKGEAGFVLASTGEVTEANRLFETLFGLVPRQAGAPVYAALVALGLGQFDKALELMKLNVPANIMNLHALVQWHCFDKLVGDVRFRRLMEEAH